MKRTLPAFRIRRYPITWTALGPVTCEVTGEWADGSKIWSDEQGNQYSLCRQWEDRKYCFRLEATA